jgi:hypothetical protein
MPTLALCEPCRGTKVTTVELLEHNPEVIGNTDERHRLAKGKPLSKTNVQCSVCKKQMKCAIFCSNCTEEATKLIINAEQIVRSNK